MKLRLLIAAILVWACSGCVPYYYNDPYYNPYGYAPYRAPAVYVNPGFYYPQPWYSGHYPYYGGGRYR